jgi:hypothetical protein
MTTGTPLERIGEMLEGAGYRRLETPLKIAGLSFEIGGAYLAKPPAPDLVLLADTAFQSQEHILRTIEGVGRALDVLKSRRPLTAILAGPKPRDEVVEALAKFSRVLPVGVPPDGDVEATLQNWLAILMPLTLPQPTQDIGDPLGELSTHLDGLDPQVADLPRFAAKGSAAIQRRLHELLTMRLTDQGDRHDQT